MLSEDVIRILLFFLVMIILISAYGLVTEEPARKVVDDKERAKRAFVMCKSQIPTIENYDRCKKSHDMAMRRINEMDKKTVGMLAIRE